MLLDSSLMVGKIHTPLAVLVSLKAYIRRNVINKGWRLNQKRRK
jgi:hypothetical protein